jgi:hypothetical protein
MTESMTGRASKLWLFLLAAVGCGGSEQNEMTTQDVTQQAGVGGGIGAAGGVSAAGGGGGVAGTGVPLAGASGAGGAAGTIGAGTGGSAPPIPEGACLDCAIPPACQGFTFKGIRYSPGGTTLPNTCEPFHATLNNPYAVRCIDVYPAFDSGFPGDEYCVLPPPPELGMQVGLHPQGTPDQYWEQIWAGDYSGYQNAGGEWVIEAGGEITQNYRGHSTNTEEKNYYRTYFRMRTGSHHNIITMHDGDMPDGWIPQDFGEALPGLFDASSGQVNGVLGGQQRPDDSTPVTLDKPAEDAGLYLRFPASASIIYNMHHFNPTEDAILREGWSNIWFEQDATVLASWYMGLEPSQVVLLNVGANQAADYHYQWDVAEEIRLIRVFGHRHFWTTNFSAWIERDGGTTELIYQSYDWEDMPTYRYDSVVTNPALNPEAKVDGAVSGVVTLNPGDQLHFNCHIEFTDERATQDSAAPLASELGNLRFANQAYNGEMCIQFGNVSGGRLGLPYVSSTAVPDFATSGR